MYQKITKSVLKAVVAVIIVLLLILWYLFHSFAKSNKTPFLTDAEARKSIEEQYTLSTKKTVETKIQPVVLDRIKQQTLEFSNRKNNDDEHRRTYCIELFKGAGYEPNVTDTVIFAAKNGRSSDYVAIGAHYDKAEGASSGILDNMLGCILVANIAKVFKDHPTKYTYVFLCYGDEEVGSKIGAATSCYRPGIGNEPDYVIEIDYVGDKNHDLAGRYLGPLGGRFKKIGIKLATHVWASESVIHTVQDNIENVDFDRAYLAYKTVISMVEGIEETDELKPPDTVFFFKKEHPIWGSDRGF
jgi:hypothetical protein